MDSKKTFLLFIRPCKGIEVTQIIVGFIVFFILVGIVSYTLFYIDKHLLTK